MGLDETLEHGSISQINAYGLVAVLALGFTEFGIAMLATGTLWRSQYWEKVRDNTWVGGFYHPWVQGPGWMATSILAPVSLFLFIERFHNTLNTGVVPPENYGNPGDFNWVYGWFLAGLFSQFLVPLTISSVSILAVSLIPFTTMELSYAMAFGYMFAYTGSTYQHLSVGDPAQWVLLFPVAWGLISWIGLLFVSWSAWKLYDGGNATESDQQEYDARSSYSEKYYNEKYGGMLGGANGNNQTEVVYRSLLNANAPPQTNVQSTITANQFMNMVSPAPSSASLGGYSGNNATVVQMNSSNTSSQLHSELNNISGGVDFQNQSTAMRHKGNPQTKDGKKTYQY
jgi:hypothetical protein